MARPYELPNGSVVFLSDEEKPSFVSIVFTDEDELTRDFPLLLGGREISHVEIDGQCYERCEDLGGLEMLHHVMLPIEVNTDAIEQKLEHDAVENVTALMFKEIKRNLPKKYSYRGTDGEIDWRDYADDIGRSFLEVHKDEIIEAATKMLCESMKRTKVYKEAVAGVVADA